MLVDISDHSACNGVHTYVVSLHVLLIIFTVEVSYFWKRSKAKNTVEVVYDPNAKFRQKDPPKRNNVTSRTARWTQWVYSYFQVEHNSAHGHNSIFTMRSPRPSHSAFLELRRPFYHHLLTNTFSYSVRIQESRYMFEIHTIQNIVL
jgi:hypothetical protein